MVFVSMLDFVVSFSSATGVTSFSSFTVVFSVSVLGSNTSSVGDFAGAAAGVVSFAFGFATCFSALGAAFFVVSLVSFADSSTAGSAGVGIDSVAGAGLTA